MQSLFLRRLVNLAAAAQVFCAASAFAQNAANGGGGAAELSQQNAPSPFYSTAPSEQVDNLSVGPALAPMTAFESMRSEQPRQSWWASRFSNEAYRPSNLPPVCDDCPNHGVYIFVGYDSWRGISDGDWQNNGIHSGLNYGTRLGQFSDLTGVGFQIGGSAGAYNWAGTDYRLSHQDQAQPQGFITYGLFRKANENCRWSAAVVQDWMLNSNFGVFAENPTLSQWRGQVGYATNAWNEFGIWGTWRALGDTRNVPGFGSTSWRPINQLNAYWHYKWGIGGADTMIWVGVPERDRLAGGGSLGDYIASAWANVPLSDRVALYTQVTYMHQSSRPGPDGSNQDAWNFTTGIAFYPGRNARSNTVAGRCWMPQLPVANNGFFLVDTNRNF